MDALNQKLLLPSTAPASPVPAGFCSRSGCLSQSPSRDFQPETKEVAPLPRQGWSLAVREREWPVSFPPCCATQVQVERAWAVGKEWFLFPSQLAESVCQSLNCCLLKNTYLRDFWVSIMCTVFIQRDITTMWGNSYSIKSTVLWSKSSYKMLLLVEKTIITLSALFKFS